MGGCTTSARLVFRCSQAAQQLSCSHHAFGVTSQLLNDGVESLGVVGGTSFQTLEQQANGLVALPSAIAAHMQQFSGEFDIKQQGFQHHGTLDAE